LTTPSTTQGVRQDCGIRPQTTENCGASLGGHKKEM